MLDDSDATGASSTLTGSPVEVEGTGEMETEVEAEGCSLENHLLET
jgi:hypothetical protein